MPFNVAAQRCSNTSRLRAKRVDGLAQGVILPVAPVRLREPENVTGPKFSRV
jgi:hypothetical protein